MKILVTVAMSIDKRNAETFLTAQLPQVLENLVKISLFAVLPATIKEWQDEIADKHLTAIRKVVNNLTTKKGHLDKKIITDIWLQIFTLDDFQSILRKCNRSKNYADLNKVQPNSEHVVKMLQAQAAWFAKNILINKLEQDDIIADRLVDIVLSSKDYMRSKPVYP